MLSSRSQIRLEGAILNEVWKMQKDFIVAEIRKYRDEYAKKFNYDLHKICQDIRKKQGKDGRRVVSLSPRPANVFNVATSH